MEWLVFIKVTAGVNLAFNPWDWVFGGEADVESVSGIENGLETSCS